MMNKAVVRYALTLCAICLVVGGLLAAVNFLTAGRIAAIEVENSKAARKAVLEGVTFDAEVALPQGNAWKYTLAGETVGFAAIGTGSGYGGEITLMVGMNQNFVVQGVYIISHSETPGLGSKAQEVLAGQFVGKTSPFSVVKRDAKANEINAITGATITSEAVTDIVNKTVSGMRNLN